MAITSDTPTIATRLDEDDRIWLERRARACDRSVAAELRQAVKFYRRGLHLEDHLPQDEVQEEGL